MTSKLGPIYFWQRIISPHMAGLAAALAQRGHQVTYVAEREMSRERAAQGWKAPNLGSVRCQLAGDIGAVDSVVRQAPIDSVHICQGMRANGLVQRAQQQLRRRGMFYWITMETIDDEGWAGLAKRLVILPTCHGSPSVYSVTVVSTAGGKDQPAFINGIRSVICIFYNRIRAKGV